MAKNSPIKTGSIVSYTDHEKIWVGIVVRMNTWNPVGLQVKVPGKFSAFMSVELPLERCYNATEAERKEYFKEVLKYG